MRSRLFKTLIASTVAAFALVTAFGASAALAVDPPPSLLNTALPSITGSSTVGGLLGTDTGIWDTVASVDGEVTEGIDVTPDSFSYQWYTVSSTSVYAPVGGATASTLTVPPSAYTAGWLAVEVTAHLTGFEDATVTSNPVSVLPRPEIIWNSAQPTMTNVFGDYVAIGSTLTVGTGGWQPADPDYSFSYQWVTAETCAALYSDGGDPIADATTNTLVVPADALNLCVAVIVTASAEGFSSSGSTTRVAGVAVVDATGSVSGYALDKRGDPVVGLTINIFGGPTTETVVTDATGYYSKAGLAFGTYWFQWDGTADLAPGYPSGYAVLSPADPHATFDVTPRALNRVYGTLTDADGLGIEGASFYLPGSGYNFQAPTGADGSFDELIESVSNGTYDLNFQMPDCSSSNVVPATPFNVVNTGVHVTLDDWAVDASNHGSITVYAWDRPQLNNITPRVGNMLTTTTGTWHCATDATYDYQWYRDGVEIPDATSASYTVVEADGGAELSSKVWAVTSFGKKHGITSEPTAEVELGAAPVASVSPSITWSGTGTAPMFGDTLSVDLGTWSLPGTATYVWLQRAFNDGSTTVLGTGPTLVPPPSAASSSGAVGRDSVEVVVTYHVPGHEDAIEYPSGVHVDRAPAPVLLDQDSLVVTGDLRVGEDVSFDLGDWDTPGAYASYSGWFMGPDAGITFSTLSTGSSFTIPASYPGYGPTDPSTGAFVTVAVIVSAPGHEPAAAVFATAGPIAAGPIGSVTPVEVDGEGTVGWTLSAIEGTYTSTPATRDYTWFEGSTTSGPWTLLSEEDIVNPNLAQLGKYIIVRETVTAADGSSAESESTPLLIDTDDPTWASSYPWVSYTGTPVVGNTLTAVPGTWDRVLDSVEYSWILRLGPEENDHEVGTGPTYVPQPSDVGGYLFLAEIGTVDGGIPHVFYAVTTIVLAAPTPPADPSTDPAPGPGPSPSPSPSTTPNDPADADPTESELDTEADADTADAEDSESDNGGTDSDEPAGDGTNGSESASGAPGDETGAGAFPLVPVLFAGGGIIVIGGLAFAGWWFFIRKPF